MPRKHNALSFRTTRRLLLDHTPSLGLKILPGTHLSRLGFQLQAESRGAIGEIEIGGLDVKLVAGTGARHEVGNVGTEHDSAKAGISSGGVEVEDIGIGTAVRHDRLGVPATDKGAVGHIVRVRDGVLDLAARTDVDKLTTRDFDLCHPTRVSITTWLNECRNGSVKGVKGSYLHAGHSRVDQGSGDGRAFSPGLDSVRTVGRRAAHSREEGKTGSVQDGTVSVGVGSVGGERVAGGRSQGGRSDENQGRKHLGARTHESYGGVDFGR